MSARTGGIHQVGRKPSRVPFCSRDCGRRVWNFSTGLCAKCDPGTSLRSAITSAHARARAARRELLGEGQ